jgi:hypothetical protein
MLISESSINTENLFIKKNSVLTIKNSSIFISGDLYINSQSTIVLNEDDNFTIKHCAFLDGSLIFSANQPQTGKRFLIITSQCINGTFSSVSVNLTDTPQCNVIIPHLEHLQDSLYVYFDLVDHCNNEVQSWIYIIIGIFGFLLLLFIIVSAFVIRRNLEKRKKYLEKIERSIQKEILQ